MTIKTPATMAALMALVVGMAEAESPSLHDQRPQARSDATPAAVQLASLSAQRPVARDMSEDLQQTDAAQQQPAGFDGWRRSFEQRAAAAGISAATLARARPFLRFNDEIVGFDRNQSEFVKPIWTYLDSAVSDTRIANGQAMLTEHAELLAQIEARYGVEAEIVTAVWGLESAYGTFRGSHNILEAMASLAFDGRRRAFFEEQLIAALKILQSGDTEPGAMLGSWAGAMGHTQFIPTSYLAYAVDFDGDGRRDIWSDDPADALASTAAYLARFGWEKGKPWGVEVILPDGFDYSQTGRRITMAPAEWRAMGVEPAPGVQLPAEGDASILLPAGAQGVALMVFDNFGVIERYNSADAYVIAVGHLADRFGGAPAFAQGWPRSDQPLGADQRLELQRRLTAAGFDTQGIDGRIGPNTIAAIRRYQQAHGLIPDGYASFALLERLR